MADIALLVAEDFERSNKAGWEKADHHGMCFHILASFTVSALGREARERVSSLKLKEVDPAAKEAAAAARTMEPESSFGLAAFDGLFSA